MEGARLKREKGHFSSLIFRGKMWIVLNCYSQDHRVRCEVKKQSNHASNKWGASMKHSGGWLLFEQQLFVPRHVTLWQKVHWALLVSIPLALLTSSEALKCARRADMPPDLFESEKCLQCPLVGAEFLERRVQQTDSGKLQGVCREDWLENKLKAVPILARSVELWWSTLADNSYSTSIYLFQSKWHCGRRCVELC